MNKLTIEAIALALDALTWNPSGKEKAIAALKIIMEQEKNCIEIICEESK